jgi:integrase
MKEETRMGKRGNGEGSISRRKDGRWWGRYTVNTLDGPKQKAVYGKTRADVAAKLRKAMAEADEGLLLDAGNMTVGKYLDRWLSDCVLPLVESGKLEHSTYVGYAGIVRNHLKPALGRRRLKDLSRPEVRALYAEKSKKPSPRSIDYLHITLQKALKQAMRDDLLPRNVADGERPRSSRNKEEAKAFSKDQVKAQLTAAGDERNHALYVMAVYTGLRQGELLGLKWEDVDLGDRPKVSVRRSLKATAEGDSGRIWQPSGRGSRTLGATDRWKNSSTS